MRSKAPALFPVYRSRAQAEILAATLPYPDAERTVTDLARDLEMPLTTVSNEVSRLVDAEILTARWVGRSKLLGPNTAHRLIAPLTEIVLATMGPHRAVGEAFVDVPGVQQVVLYGSWAARYHGETGPPPRDLDVLVVGAPDRADVYGATERIEHRLGLPVQVVVVSESRWAEGDDPLMQDIRSRPTVDTDLQAEGAEA